MASTYTCPTCGTKMERDIMLFYKHTDQHIVDEIKKQHPRWISEDGFCAKCVDFFKTEMGKPGMFGIKKTTNSALVNIGIGGARARTILGVVCFAAAAGGLWFLVDRGAPKSARLILFPAIFAGMLGLIQARERICVILGGKGTTEAGGAEQAVPDAALKKALRKASLQIILLALFLSVALMALATVP